MSNQRVTRVSECEHTSKRQRMGPGPEFVYVSCFDEPDKHVEVDLSLLDASGCRLGLLIRNSDPLVHASGRLFYRAGSTMTRAMLITMVKSMALGHLVLSKGVTIGEALSVFEYEGLNVSGAAPSKITVPKSGLAFAKRDEPVLDCLQSLCEQIADAILQWPRLESILNAHIPTDTWNRANRSALGDPYSITSTATRVWIRFADKPKCDAFDNDRDTPLSLATKSPIWLMEGLISLGIVHARLSQENKEFGLMRDQASFNKLYEQINSDTLGTFYQVKLDSCKMACDAKTKKEIIKGEKFYNEIRNTVLAADAETRPYARAAVQLVYAYRKEAPNCCRIFSGACADDTGCTLERTTLKKALKARGVTVVKWMETRDQAIRPLVFPPSWRDNNSACYGPSVLLSFENII